MKNADIKIFRVLYRKKKPMTAYKISKEAKISTRESYEIARYLAKQGILLQFNTCKTTSYALNPTFYSKDFWKDYIQILEKPMKKIYEVLKIEDTEPDPTYLLPLLVRVLSQKH
jgi:predicted DNA-binding transcriptional regulator